MVEKKAKKARRPEISEAPKKRRHVARVDLADIEIEQARRHFRRFVQLFWPIIEPRTELSWNWHLDVLCDHLQALGEGRARDMVINVPPRSLKSTVVSVMFPAWVWVFWPECRFVTGSYDLGLAQRDAVKSRNVMRSAEYKKVITRNGRDELPWKFSGDQNLKGRYENTKTGQRLCVSPGSGGMGEGGDFIFVDDPHNPKEAESKVTRQSVIDWWNQTMSSRGNSRKARFLIVMQRLQENDLSADALGKGYEHLMIPCMYEAAHPFVSHTSLGYVDPRTREGQLLHPDRFGPDEVALALTKMGSYGVAGQLQQRPRPAGGGLFKLHCFNFYLQRPIDFDLIFSTWDLSFIGRDERKGYKAEIQNIKDPSFVVGLLIGVVGPNAYVLDESRGQWDIVQTIGSMLKFTQLWSTCTKHLIENKANGPAVERLLSEKVPGIELIEPKGSKVQRAIAIHPIVESRNLWLPDPSIAPWVGSIVNPPENSFLGEVCGFPNAKHNDRVDALSQGLLYAFTGKGSHALRLLQSVTQW